MKNPKGPNYHIPQSEPDKTLTNNEIVLNITENKSQSPAIGGITPQSIRKAFIVKVLGIIFCQMLVSVLFVVCAMFIETFKRFQEENIVLFLVALFVEIFLFVLMICNKKICRRVPFNYITLFVFTIAVSYILSFICARTKPEAVLVATISTTGLVLLLTLYSCLTKRDLTTSIGILLYLPIAGIFIILFLSVWNGYIVQIIISLVIVAIFSAYLAYDIQKLSGKFGDEYTIDDYVFAALQIYVDIILIFKNLLYIFGGSN